MSISYSLSAFVEESKKLCQNISVQLHGNHYEISDVHSKTITHSAVSSPSVSSTQYIQFKYHRIKTSLTKSFHCLMSASSVHLPSDVVSCDN